MQKNIEDYLFHKKDFLDKSYCQHAVTTLESRQWDRHDFTGYEKNDPEHGFGWQREVTSTFSGHSEPDYLGHTSQGWNVATADINNHIINELPKPLTEYIRNFGFRWFDGWNGYSVIKFLKYAETQQMAEHCDHINSLFDGKIKGIPTLSIVGQLNDNYEGGEFVMFGDRVVDMKAGDMIVFPSNFMYPHRVEPVTKGARYSYVSWLF